MSGRPSICVEPSVQGGRELRTFGATPNGQLIDGFARKIDYLRVSVTDRCDLRCTCCMPERMVFAPKAETFTDKRVV